MDKSKSVTLSLFKGKDLFHIECLENESIQEAMQRHNIYVSAVCGGKGTCGKCGIALIRGSLDITIADRAIFAKEELEKGYRLSCKAYPKEDCVIRFYAEDEDSFDIVSDYEENVSDNQEEQGDIFVIGIDIGTTTIAMNLVNQANRQVIKIYSTVNRQRAFGADVIARMQASNNGKKEELQKIIQHDILEGIRYLIEASNIAKSKVIKLAIACNTTMGHLLMGYSCETLGIYPYTPVNIELTTIPFGEVFASDYMNIPVILLPGISTFVGGDIVAGLFACDFDQSSKTNLFIDLGTNGEMAIGNKEQILVSSTAAGPAFEGGNISCGVGSISGAVCNVSINENKVSYQTINAQPPNGICGTGVIEITSELFNARLMDETGLLMEPYFEEGFTIAERENEYKIKFTQKDIRELQLAKAAIRAGIEILLRAFSISYDQIDTVFLAGGFGYKVNIEKAVNIGILPKEFMGKIKSIGNSSLAGTVKYLIEDNSQARFDKLRSVSKEISLSNEADFNELYIEYINF